MCVFTMLFKKGIIVEYLPENIRQRRYEKNIYKNNTYTMQCRENESRFHYLCFPVL